MMTTKQELEHAVTTALINCVKEFPLVYDLSNKDHKNRHKVDLAWEKINTAMESQHGIFGFSVTDLKSKFFVIVLIKYTNSRILKFHCTFHCNFSEFATIARNIALQSLRNARSHIHPI